VGLNTVHPAPQASLANQGVSDIQTTELKTLREQEMQLISRVEDLSSSATIQHLLSLPSKFQ
jgi:hypothetical protein